MPNILRNLIPTAGTLLLAPVLIFLCLILFPVAVITTYVAFVALAVRAALVYTQVVAATIRHQLGLDDDYTNTSSWAPRLGKEDLKGRPIQRASSRKSSNSGHVQSASLPRPLPTETLASLERTITMTLDPLLSQENETLSSVSSIASSMSPENSRPGSTHSSFMARDYEGVGGWYALPASSTSKPETAPANFEWLVMNARLELPNADPSSSTRPRTPEERNRSSSISGRSHRSMVSLSRRNHHRTATTGSAEMTSTDEVNSTEPALAIKADSLERSNSGILVPSEMNKSEGSNAADKQGIHKSMISLSEKGSRLAYKLAGWKSLGLKKKANNEPMSSPEESANEESKNQNKGTTILSDPNRRKNISHELSEGTSTPINSGPGSIEGVETGGLTMWMDP